MLSKALLLVLGLMWPLLAASAAVDIEAYLKHDKFTGIKLSPTGEYLAASIPLEDRIALAIIRRSNNELIGSFSPGKDGVVHTFDWISDQRVLIAIAQKRGSLDQPQPTGELFAMEANGEQAQLLIGYRVKGGGLGTRNRCKQPEKLAARLVDDLRADPRNVLVSIWPLGRHEPYTRAERLDVYDGRRLSVARAPVPRASFTTDNGHEVRFAHGAGADNVSKLYYRQGLGDDWELVNDAERSGRIETPIGFSEDNQTVYLKVEHGQGPDSIVAWDLRTDQRREVVRDRSADPHRILYRNGSKVPVGVLVVAEKARTLFFDPASPEASLYRSLEAVFAGEAVYITSATRDGRQLLLQVYCDRNPGDFYLYDTASKQARYLIGRREWLDPEQNARVEAISLPARDGMQLHGYITVPNAGSGKPLPMVVMPHGGPFGIYDRWRFDDEAQMLAQAGYAVLQLNFRGSGNYGRSYQRAGRRQWGKAMQDDLTDATQWAIEHGYAEAARICIYGASYGAYAALMGVAREPELYRCAAGYAGVYDLPLMFSAGDIPDSASGRNYLQQWLGEQGELASVSPVNLADRINVPVFLAAGGNDERAPIKHSKRMQVALSKAGIAVETLYYDTEGHGFYTHEHQREFYTRLLAFLSHALGGQPALASNER